MAQPWRICSCQFITYYHWYNYFSSTLLFYTYEKEILECVSFRINFPHEVQLWQSINGFHWIGQYLKTTFKTKLNWWFRLEFELWSINLNIFLCDFNQKHETCNFTSEYLHKYKRCPEAFSTQWNTQYQFTNLIDLLAFQVLSRWLNSGLERS